MLPQNLTQPSLQQVGCSVVAHSGLADISVDHGVNFLAHADRLFRSDLISLPLDWVVATFPLAKTVCDRQLWARSPTCPPDLA